jgi:hypothetical protein
MQSVAGICRLAGNLSSGGVPEKIRGRLAPAGFLKGKNGRATSGDRGWGANGSSSPAWLGDRRCSLGGGDCQRYNGSEQTACLTKVQANSTDRRLGAFSICNRRLVERPDLGPLSREKKRILQVARVSHLSTDIFACCADSRQNSYGAAVGLRVKCEKYTGWRERDLDAPRACRKFARGIGGIAPVQVIATRSRPARRR